MKRIGHILRDVWAFYVTGFREMTWGRTLWILILVKLFLIFVVLRLFFFRPTLQGLDNDAKSETVGNNLTLPQSNER